MAVLEYAMLGPNEAPDALGPPPMLQEVLHAACSMGSCRDATRCLAWRHYQQTSQTAQHTSGQRAAPACTAEGGRPDAGGVGGRRHHHHHAANAKHAPSSPSCAVHCRMAGQQWTLESVARKIADPALGFNEGEQGMLEVKLYHMKHDWDVFSLRAPTTRSLAGLRPCWQQQVGA